jgi:uncharacterized protein
MLNAPTKKTALALNQVSVTPGPLPGTEPDAGSPFKIKGKVTFEGLWRLFRLIKIMVIIGGAIAVIGLLLYRQPSTVKFGDSTFNVTVADDNAEREKGLGNTNRLAPNTGMLFVFEDSFYWQMWMKDMNFPIDIIWLNYERKVIAVDRNVQPGSYPQTYTPPDPVMYVLEVPAGDANRNGIKVGDLASIDIDP